MTDAEKYTVLCKAFDHALIGGNHLASNLIGELGAGKEEFPVKGTPHEKVRQLFKERFGDRWINYYDQWCCWNALMQARDIVEETLGENAWKEQL